MKFGRLPLSIYSGGVAFESPQDARKYLEQQEKLDDGWKVYLLSGDFDLDTADVNGKRFTNKSLLVVTAGEGSMIVENHRGVG